MESVELCERALAFQRANLDGAPSDLAVRHSLRDASIELAKAKRALGDRAGASETVESMIRDMPDDPLALAMAVGCLEDRAAAQSAVERAANLGRLDSRVQYVLAYVLATSPDPNLRDPSQAVALARRALASSPRKGAYWSILGQSLFRAGKSDEAVPAIEQAESLPGRLGGLDALVLALAHARQGDVATARRDYDRALEWSATYSPTDQEAFDAFRAEAEAALVGNSP